jgi:hypothetical protein
MRLRPRCVVSPDDHCTPVYCNYGKAAKKAKTEVVIPVEDLSPLAHPLAQRKLLKKLHKTIKKGTTP